MGFEPTSPCGLLDFEASSLYSANSFPLSTVKLFFSFSEIFANAAAVAAVKALSILTATRYLLLRSTWVAIQPVLILPRTVSLSQLQKRKRFSAPAGRLWIDTVSGILPRLSSPLHFWCFHLKRIIFFRPLRRMPLSIVL